MRSRKKYFTIYELMEFLDFVKDKAIESKSSNEDRVTRIVDNFRNSHIKGRTMTYGSPALYGRFGSSINTLFNNLEDLAIIEETFCNYINQYTKLFIATNKNNSGYFTATVKSYEILTGDANVVLNESDTNYSDRLSPIALAYLTMKEKDLIFGEKNKPQVLEIHYPAYVATDKPKPMTLSGISEVTDLTTIETKILDFLDNQDQYLVEVREEDDYYWKLNIKTQCGREVYSSDTFTSFKATLYAAMREISEDQIDISNKVKEVTKQDIVHSLTERLEAEFGDEVKAVLRVSWNEANVSVRLQVPDGLRFPLSTSEFVNFTDDVDDMYAQIAKIIREFEGRLTFYNAKSASLFVLKDIFEWVRDDDTLKEAVGLKDDFLERYEEWTGQTVGYTQVSRDFEAKYEGFVVLSKLMLERLINHFAVTVGNYQCHSGEIVLDSNRVYYQYRLNARYDKDSEYRELVGEDELAFVNELSSKIDMVNKIKQQEQQVTVVLDADTVSGLVEAIEGITLDVTVGENGIEFAEPSVEQERDEEFDYTRALRKLLSGNTSNSEALSESYQKFLNGTWVSGDRRDR